MDENFCKKVLYKDLLFSTEDIEKLEIFSKMVKDFNQNYNIISKSTESTIWSRHILDSAQIIKFINFSERSSLSDFGTGAGFPGIVISIFNKNKRFHVKLYEKSPVKCQFLRKLVGKLEIQAEIIENNVLNEKITSEYIVSRAFKKLSKLMQFSREIAKKPFKMIIMKGKSAQEEINKAFKVYPFKYKLENSITDTKSKIILVNVEN